MKQKLSDIAIVGGIIALIVFAFLTRLDPPARGTSMPVLFMQGGGVSYGAPVNDRATELEYACRDKLYELGGAEAGYAQYVASGKYAYLDELIYQGYLTPNVSGGTLVSGYSISFYLPPGKRGFTLVAEPTDFTLRAFMLTENLDVVTLTSSVEDDPNDDWADVRRMERDYLNMYGLYRPLSSQELTSYETPLQVRLNREQTQYALMGFMENTEGGWGPDDSLLYLSVASAYLVGSVDEY